MTICMCPLAEGNIYTATHMNNINKTYMKKSTFFSCFSNLLTTRIAALYQRLFLLLTCVQTSGKGLNSAGTGMRQPLMTSSSNIRKQSEG